MATLPASNYASDNARTQLEIKQFFENILTFIRQLPGGAAPVDVNRLTFNEQGSSATGIQPDGNALLRVTTGSTDSIQIIHTANTPPGTVVVLSTNVTAGVTIVHDASTSIAGTIKLAGSEDYLLAGDNTITFALYGTEWVEICRSEGIGTSTGSGGTHSSVLRLYYKRTVNEPTAPDLSGTTPTHTTHSSASPAIIDSPTIGPASNLWYRTPEEAAAAGLSGRLWAVHVDTVVYNDDVSTIKYFVGAVAKYVVDVPVVATEEQALAGTDNSAYITSQLMKAAIDAYASKHPTAQDEFLLENTDIFLNSTFYPDGYTTPVVTINDSLLALRAADHSNLDLFIHFSANYQTGQSGALTADLQVQLVSPPDPDDNITVIAEVGAITSLTTESQDFAMAVRIPQDVTAFELRFIIDNSDTTILNNVRAVISNPIREDVVDLEDTPSSYGFAGQVLVVNQERTAMVWATPTGLRESQNDVVAGTVTAGDATRQATITLTHRDGAITTLNIPLPPGATNAVRGILRLATLAEARAGTLSTVGVTPAGAKAMIDDATPDASQAQRGLVRIGTNAEASAGTSGILAVSPAGLAAALAAYVPNLTAGHAINITGRRIDVVVASTAASGAVRLATDEEVIAGSSTGKVATAAGVKAAIDAIPPSPVAIIDSDEIRELSLASRNTPVSERTIRAALDALPSTGGGALTHTEIGSQDVTLAAADTWVTTTIPVPTTADDNDLFYFHFRTRSFDDTPNTQNTQLIWLTGEQLKMLLVTSGSTVDHTAGNLFLTSVTWTVDNETERITFGFSRTSDNFIRVTLDLAGTGTGQILPLTLVQVGVTSSGAGGSGGARLVGQHSDLQFTADDRWHRTEIVFPELDDIDSNDLFILDFGDTETQANLQLSQTPTFTGRSVRALPNYTEGGSYDFNGTAIHVSFNVVFSGGGSELQAAIGKDSSRRLLIALESSSSTSQAMPLRLLRIRAGSGSDNAAAPTPSSGPQLQVQQDPDAEPVIWGNNHGDRFLVVAGTQYSNIAVNEANNGVGTYRYSTPNKQYNYPAINQGRMAFTGDEVVAFDFDGGSSRWPDKIIIALTLVATNLPQTPTSMCDILWGENWRLVLYEDGQLNFVFGSDEEPLTAGRPNLLASTEYRIAIALSRQTNGDWQMFADINNERPVSATLTHRSDPATEVFVGRSERNGTGEFTGFIYDLIIAETQREPSATLVSNLTHIIPTDPNPRTDPYNYASRIERLRSDGFSQGTALQIHLSFTSLENFLATNGSGALEYDARDGHGNLPGGIFFHAYPTPSSISLEDLSIQIVDSSGNVKLIGSQTSEGRFIPPGALDGGILKVFVRVEGSTELTQLRVDLQPYGVQSDEGPREYLWAKKPTNPVWFGSAGIVNAFEDGIDNIYTSDLEYVILFCQAGHADYDQIIITPDRIVDRDITATFAAQSRKAYDFAIMGWTLGDSKVGLGTIDNFGIPSGVATSVGRFVRYNDSPVGTIRAVHWVEHHSSPRRCVAILLVGKPGVRLRRN